jgi:hypothetical protein
MTPTTLRKHIDRLGYETDPIRSAPLVVILDPDLPADDQAVAVADVGRMEAAIEPECPTAVTSRFRALRFEIRALGSPNSSIPEDAAEPGRPYREDPIVVEGGDR